MLTDEKFLPLVGYAILRCSQFHKEYKKGKGYGLARLSTAVNP